MARSKQLKHGDSVLCVLLLDGVRKLLSDVRGLELWAAVVFKPIEEVGGVNHRVGLAENLLCAGTVNENRQKLSGESTRSMVNESEITIV
jgi:hypothetical protein